MAVSDQTNILREIRGYYFKRWMRSKHFRQSFLGLLKSAPPEIICKSRTISKMRM
jgi:hypothetical protein